MSQYDHTSAESGGAPKSEAGVARGPTPGGCGNDSGARDLGGHQEALAVQDIARTITLTLDLPNASGRFLDAIRNLVDCQVAAIFTIDRFADTVHTALFASTLPILREPGDSWPLSGGSVEHHINAGAPHIQQETAQPLAFPGERKYLEAGIQSSLWAPLCYSGQAIGTVVLRGTRPDTFGQEDLARMERVAAAIAPAVAMSALHQETLRQKQFAQALNRISNTLNATLEPREVLERICRECCQLLRLGFVTLWEVEGDEIGSHISWPPSKRHLEGAEWRRSLEGTSSGLAVRVVLTGKPEIVNAPGEAPPGVLDLQLLGWSKATALMVVPLLEDGRALGCLVAGHTEPNKSFTSQSLSMAEAFAAHAATALRNARLHEAVRQGAAETALADQVARIITSTLEIDQVYQEFAGALRNLVDADRVYILTADQDAGTYTIRYTFGEAVPGRKVGDTGPLAGSITGQVMVTGQTVNRPDVAAQVLVPADEVLLQQGLRSSIIVPLVSRGRVFGTLGLRSRRVGAYGPRQQAILEHLAHQIAPAIEKARLYEEAQTERSRATSALAQLRAVLDVADAGILLVNDRQQVLMMNRRFAEFFGVPDVAAIIPDGKPAPMHKLRDQDRACFADPDAFFAERDRLDADRSFAGILGEIETVYPARRLLREFTAPVRDEEGNYLGRLWIYHDVAEQKRGEAALRESEGRFRAMVESTNDILWELDAEGRYTYCSPNVASIIGYQPEEMLGKTPFDFMPPEEAQRVADLFLPIVVEGKPFALLTHEVCCKDGRRCVMECSGRPVFDEQGRLAGYRGVDRDITERKQLEEQLLHAQKMESLGRLAGGIAHDFNNLLAGILGFASLLRSRLMPGTESHEFAQIIENATQRGALLTQQLLTAGRKGPFMARPMDVNLAVNDVVQILSHTLPKDISINTQLQPDLPSIYGDMGQIHQVLMNLCINAADALPGGGDLNLATRTVYLGKEFCRQRLLPQPGEYIELSVSDTGVGISEEDRSRIFEPFFTTKESGKGTGLGLSVVYGVVQKHNGAIEVKSEPDHGSTFTIYLPVYQPAQTEAIDNQ